MRFLVHGAVSGEGRAALVKQEQSCHDLGELAGAVDVPEGAAGDPAVLMPLLEKKQWNLVTTETGFLRELYEKHVAFSGVVVQLLDDAGVLEKQGEAIERLFERYKRLTPRRLYTVTSSRVKIRQLPGGHE